MRLLYFTVLLLNSIHDTTSDIIVRNDEFHGYLNGIYHKFVDKNGAKWELPTKQNKLELLLNDYYNEHQVTLETCVSDLQRMSMLDSQRRENVTFEEIAKMAGFTHVHRAMPPQKPHCQFDTVIEGPYNYSARFEGEGCMVEQMTGGAAAGDYDNDGYVDIFFTVFYGPSLLYRNNGDGTFTDVSKECGVGPSLYGNGAGWVDIDSDGDLDLYVTTLGDMRHYLYINQGGHFTEEAVERGISLKFPSQRKIAGMTPAFGDFDRDGYIDVFTTEWIIDAQAGSKVSANKLFRNKGSENPGHFEDVTVKARINIDDAWSNIRNTHNDGTHAFGASFTDYDDDGWPELFIIGDFGESRMFWNNQDGTFTECTIDCGIDDKENAMGYAIGDINNDQKMDMFISGAYLENATCSMYSCKFSKEYNGNGLYLSDGKRNFTDATLTYDVEDSQWAWGASFIDFDNNGKLDIVVTNGIQTSAYVKDEMNLFENKGNGKKMVDVAVDVGMKYDGMGRGLLVFDYDNDGDEDVVVVGNVGLPKLFKNNGGNMKNWIKIKPMHRCENNSNKSCDSYGAVVTVTSPDGLIQTAQVGSKTHFLGQSEITVHFGLGVASSIDVKVWWPRFNKSLTIQNVAVNQMLKVFPQEEAGIKTIPYQSVAKCQHLRIKEITQQPQNGKIIINNDRKSVRYDTGDYTIIDVGLQHFKYKVEVFPTNSNNQSPTAVEGAVTMDFRGRPNLFIPECKKEMNIKPTDERRFDGLSNNKEHVMWGAAKEDLLNIAPHAYADNVSEPASACTRHHKLTGTCPYPKEFSGVGSTRPSPREISNRLMAQAREVFSKRNMSDLTMHFGQFMSHDVDHSTPLPRQDFMQYHQNQIWMPINIPKGDVHFDPYSTGKEQMPFIRSTFSGCSGSYQAGKTQRKQFNTITSILDGNTVYGVSDKRANHLREFKNGRLRMRPNLMLPKNEGYMKNANPVGRPGHELYIAGDVRANVQPGLAAMHTLFVREHNRLAHEYVLKNPVASDDEAFNYARKMLIAEMQAITYNEYLPALLGGDHHIPKYTGYKKDVKTGATNEFTTAAFRFGHSQVNTLIYRLQKNGEPIKQGHAIMREMFFKPNRLELEGGLDPIFRGALAFPTQEIDLLLVDEMRNSLFRQDAASPGKHTGFDLASFNIQRGRDHGLADFNTVRKNLGLRAYNSFYEITSNMKVAKELEMLYKDINNVDLWVGGLAEDHVFNSELGETFHALMVEQFTRIRDGDRFWYQSIMNKEEIELVEKTTFAEIIRMNTGIDECPDHVFFASRNCDGARNHQCVPKSGDMNYEYEYERVRKEKDEEMKKTLTLTIVAGVLGFVALLCLIVALALTLCGRRNIQKASEPRNGDTYTIRREVKPTFELGVTNEGVEA